MSYTLLLHTVPPIVSSRQSVNKIDRRLAVSGGKIVFADESCAYSVCYEAPVQGEPLQDDDRLEWNM